MDDARAAVGGEEVPGGVAVEVGGADRGERRGPGHGDAGSGGEAPGAVVAERLDGGEARDGEVEVAVAVLVGEDDLQLGAELDAEARAGGERAVLGAQDDELGGGHGDDVVVAVAVAVDVAGGDGLGAGRAGDAGGRAEVAAAAVAQGDELALPEVPGGDHVGPTVGVEVGGDGGQRCRARTEAAPGRGC
nr:hypothetical protein [Conexibacter sp. W3-3-2]